VFQKKLPRISKILSDPRRGAHGVGRPRKLTLEEEERVVNYVMERQRSMHRMTFSEVTHYINEEILIESNRSVSPRFVQHNLNHVQP
jgi:transposase